jgi:hypothetical protein
MHWTYDELLALPIDVYEELVAWVLETREREDALSE